MAGARPWGFRVYIRSHRFHTIYLVTPPHGWPVKVGIAEDPVQRLLGLQSANYEELRVHRFWWLPGFPIASRIEANFKQNFGDRNIRGEWFDLSPSEGVDYVEDVIEQLETWGLNQSQMEDLHDRWARKRFGMSGSGPSPLRGAPPRKDELWQRQTKRRRQPSMPRCPGDCESR